MAARTFTPAQSPEQMLREFHASKAIHAGLMPETPTADIPQWVQELRMKLLDEETDELSEAVLARDIVKIADAIGDIAYVVAGTAVAYGIPFDAVFAEVHRSNMTKINTPDEAKLVKGPGYSPPRIAEILARAGGSAAIIMHVCDDCTAGNHRLCLDQGQARFSCDDGWEGACECEHDDLAAEAGDRWNLLREEIRTERAAQDELAADHAELGHDDQTERCYGRVEALDRVLATMDRIEAGE